MQPARRHDGLVLLDASKLNASIRRAASFDLWKDSSQGMELDLDYMVHVNSRYIHIPSYICASLRCNSPSSAPHLDMLFVLDPLDCDSSSSRNSISCALQSSEYTPPLSIKRSCVPCSATLPSFSTMMISESYIVRSL